MDIDYDLLRSQGVPMTVDAEGYWSLIITEENDE